MHAWQGTLLTSLGDANNNVNRVVISATLSSELVADFPSAVCGWAVAITDDGRRQSLRERSWYSKCCVVLAFMCQK
jgi:hypothetical protein